MNLSFKAPLCTASIVLFSALGLNASPLVPGGTVSPVPNGSAPAGVPLLVDPVSLTPGGLNEGFSWKKSTGSTVGSTEGSGNFINAVYRDPNTGTLDFYYQIQNTFRSNATGQKTLINSFSLTNWANVVITSVQQLQTNVAGNFFGDGQNVEFLGATTDGITSV